MAAGGCVALNSGFEDSGSGTGGVGSSDTGQKTAGESDTNPSAGEAASAVTTVTEGESSGSGTLDSTDSTDPSGPTDSDSGHSGGSSGADSGTTSPGESSESGEVDCTPLSSVVVADDAFLRTCVEGNCFNRNYGQTDVGTLADGVDSSALLLRVPNPANAADEIEVTVYVGVEPDFAGLAFTLTAFPINPPCAWSEGPHDADVLEAGEAGVTYQACNGDPGGSVPWAGDAWSHVDLAWNLGEYVFEKGDTEGGEVFAVTILLDRLGAGPTPEAILISADIPNFNDVFVFTSEDKIDPPVVDVFSPCR